MVDALLADAASSGRCLPVLTLPRCELARTAAAQGIPVVAEAFADRAYTGGGLLLPRSQPGAVIRDLDTVVARVVRLARLGWVESADGVEVLVDARSVCVHSDTPGAARTAAAIRAALADAGVVVRAFVVPGVEAP